MPFSRAAMFQELGLPERQVTFLRSTAGNANGNKLSSVVAGVARWTEISNLSPPSGESTANRCDLPTASAFAGLLVAAGGALVKFYKSRAAPASSPVVPMMPVAPSKLAHEPQIAA